MANRTKTAEPGGRQNASRFRYERPVVTRSKAVIPLCKSERLFGAMQVLTSTGGENNLHSHPNLDGFWFVLSGQVRFYTSDNEVIADLAEHEGILIPRNYPYWFESISEEGAEVLQVEASAKPLVKDEDMYDRLDHEPRRGLLAEMDAGGPAPDTGDEV